MKAGFLLAAALQASLSFGLAGPLAAQVQQSAGVWIGGAVIGPDQPAAQAGARIEASPGGRIWLGLDVAAWSVLHDDDEACDGPADCGFPTEYVANLSAVARFEPVGERVRPYALAMAGATFPRFGTSALWGGGVGVRVLHLVGRLDLAVEWRYRRVERFADEWGGGSELMAGAHWR